MKIGIFGMGYVGCVSAGCLSEMGHQIVAVEPNHTKLDMLNAGRSPIIEPGLEELIERAVARKTLHATADYVSAVHRTDMALVCVGTPSNMNGSIDTTAVARVSEQIGKAISSVDHRYTVVIRSTVTPGTLENIVIPAIESYSGKKAGTDFGVCMNPEFLREGTAVSDFRNPPKTVIGEYDTRSGEVLAKIYQHVDAPLIRTDLAVAEMLKYADNSFHALKICFANEIGNICKSLEIDSHKVMDIFCMDTKLNISPSYLKPGFAFGGSCLPKDLRSISYLAKRHDIDIPLLNAILPSNRNQIKQVVDQLLPFKGKSIGFLGMSFKEATDDLRESPVVDVIETLIGKGFTLKIHDRDVSLARLIGANKQYIEKEIPHISDLLWSSAEELIRESDVVVAAKKDKEYRKLLENLGGGKRIVDLVRLFGPEDPPGNDYHGICW